jgi:AraC-like DNA-binding protein
LTTSYGGLDEWVAYRNFNKVVLLFKTIILLGCLQGVVVSVLLFRSRRSKQSNRLLAALILIISLASLKVYGNETGWWEGGLIPIIIENFVPFFFIFAVGPLILFYARSYLEPGFVLERRQRLQFYPVVLDLVPVLAALLFVLYALVTGGWHDGRPVGAFIDDYNTYVDIPRWLSVTLYTIAAARYTAKSAQPWPRQFVLGFFIFEGIWLLHLIPYEIPAISNKLLDRVGWYPLYVPAAILTYWLGIKGYLLSQASPSKELSPDVVRKTVPMLLRSMETDKLYRDPELNLSLLARHTGLAPKNLSAVLNQHLHKSFNEFINEYRVREIQQRLLAEGRGQLTIAGLAYECGFNSQPTFQRAFKSVTGVSPKEFLVKSGIE